MALPLLLGGVAELACRRAADERPSAALATSTEAEARFADVRLRWIGATPAERAAMRPKLVELVAWLDKRGDALEPLARAWLAIAWLDEGVPATAEAVARPLVEGRPGVARDLAILVRGVAARRLGRPAEAIEALKTVVGKIIDPFARPLLYEELTGVLLDEGRFDEALVFADAWLRSGGATPSRELQAAVMRVLARVPENVASSVLEAERNTKGGAGHSPELIAMLAFHVDRLLGGSSEGAGADSPPPRDGGVASADAVAEVGSPPRTGTTAVTSGAPIRFDPAAIALLVPTTAVGHASIAAAIVRATAATISPTHAPVHAQTQVPTHAPTHTEAKSTTDAASRSAPSMDAAASPRGPDLTRTRLAVFDTGGTRAGTAHALELAERDGAAVVIGGTTELEANALAQLAQTRHIAAVLLRAPSAPPALPAGERAMYAVLGPSRDEEYRATLKAAEQLPGERAVIDAPLETEAEARADAGADAAENVATDPLRARCDAQPKTADGTAFPIAVWRTRKVPTIVVLGDARCARRLVAELMVTPTGGVVPYRPHLVLAPSALELAHEAIHFARMVVGAGAVPADEKAPDDLRALWVDQAGPVGWWGALGHDAAVLATAAASSNLPPTTEHSALQKARLATAVRLVAAKGVLWTTTANGFSPAGVVPRTMFVRSFAAGSAARPPWLSASDHPVYK